MRENAMNPTDLPTLAARAKTAVEDEQREVLCQAFRAIFPEVSYGTFAEIDAWDEHYDRFTAMLDASAYESAAMMLVPDEFPGVPCSIHVQRSRRAGCHAQLWTNSEFNRYVNASGKTIALALTAACCLAEAARRGVSDAG